MEREITAGRVNVADSVGRNGSGSGIGDPADAPAYEAFISYSHTKYDARVAREVQRFLEGFSIPAPLREGSGGARLGKVFRDEDELAAGSSLARELEAALGSSRWLIVICSPAAAASPWVAREVETFIAQNGRTRVLAVLASGDPETAFPAALQGNFDLGAQTDPCERAGEDGAPSPHAGISDLEPLAADLRRDVARSRRRSELLRLVAPLIGCSFDDLAQRQRARRLRRMLAAGLAACACVIAVLGVVLAQQAHYSYSKELTSAEQARRDALSAYGDGDRIEALRLALDGIAPGDDPIQQAEAQSVLSEVLGVYATGRSTTPCYAINDVVSASSLTISEDGLWLAFVDSESLITVYDIRTGAIKAQLDLDGIEAEPRPAFTDVTYAAGDLLFVPLRWGGLVCFDVQQGGLLWQSSESDFMPLIARVDERRIACVEYSNDATTLVIFDNDSGGLDARIDLEGLDSAWSPKAVLAHGNKIAIATDHAVALVDIAAGDVGYVEVDLSGAVDMALDETAIYLAVSNIPDSLGGTQQGHTTMLAIDQDEVSLLWSFERAWSSYSVDFAHIDLNTRSRIELAPELWNADTSLVLVNAGSQLLAVDGASGNVVGESAADAPIASIESMQTGYTTVVDVAGTSYVATLDEEGLELFPDDTPFFSQYVWDAHEIAAGTEFYGIGCSAESIGTVLVSHLNLLVQAPGTEAVFVGRGTTGMFVSDDDSRVALTQVDNTIVVLDGSSFHPLIEINLETAGVDLDNPGERRVFFPQGNNGVLNYCILGGDGKPPKIWQFDLTSGAVIRTWEFPVEWWGWLDEAEKPLFEGCKLSSERGGCVTLSYPGGCYMGLIDAETLETVGDYASYMGTLRDIVHVNDDRILVVFIDDSLELIDAHADGIEDEKVGDALDGIRFNRNQGFASIDVAPNRKSFAVLGMDGSLTAVDAESGEALWMVGPDSPQARIIGYSQDGALLFVQDMMGSLVCYDSQSGQRVAQTDTISSAIFDCDIDEEGTRLFVRTMNQGIDLRIYSLYDGTLTPVSTVARAWPVSVDGSSILTWGQGDIWYRQPVYTLDELEAMAREELAKHEGR